MFHFEQDWNVKKKCFKCGKVKSLAAFYKHPRMADGHLGKCIECAKEDVADREAKMRLDPAWLAKERARCRVKQNKYRSECRQKIGPIRKAQARWNARNKTKRAVHAIANLAQRKGLLKKPSKCQGCKQPARRLEKHHEDYSKPLDVQWLCQKCHGLTKRKNGPSKGSANSR